MYRMNLLDSSLSFCYTHRHTRTYKPTAFSWKKSAEECADSETITLNYPFQRYDISELQISLCAIAACSYKSKRQLSSFFVSWQRFMKCCFCVQTLEYKISVNCAFVVSSTCLEDSFVTIVNTGITSEFILVCSLTIFLCELLIKLLEARWI